ncbi:MAG: hypothetical protein RBT61_04345 [Candidatus Kapabacteria bacterium]|jgi:hypothetical protein|nr:hypothetical protein [Candidatus Kapabacteria bacterium]
MKSKINILLLLLVLLIPCTVLTQDDESWSLDTLDYGNFDIESDFLFQASWGWFPTIHSEGVYFGPYLSGGSVFDEAHLSQSDYFGIFGKPLIAAFEANTEELKIRKAFSKDTEEEGPVRDYLELGFAARFYFVQHAFLRVKAAYTLTHSLLAHINDEKSFMNVHGNPKTIREANILHLREYGIHFNAGIEIPVYGVFANTENGSLESYYHLYLGLSNSLFLKSRVNQYMQILNVKDELRYSNGRDTINIVNDVRTDNLILNKYRLEIGAGMRLITDRVGGVAFELSYSYPLTGAISDDRWLQHILKITTIILFEL